MELAAAEVEANGVTVYRFYTPNNNWDQIKAAAEGAHFLFYQGHGVQWRPVNGGCSAWRSGAGHLPGQYPGCCG